MFLYTNDKDFKETLIKNGYIFISFNGQFYIFENKTNKKSNNFAMNFLKENNGKFILTNKMFC